jgi:hypothetical protein
MPRFLAYDELTPSITICGRPHNGVISDAAQAASIPLHWVQSQRSPEAPRPVHIRACIGPGTGAVPTTTVSLAVRLTSSPPPPPTTRLQMRVAASTATPSRRTFPRSNQTIIVAGNGAPRTPTYSDPSPAAVTTSSLTPAGPRGFGGTGLTNTTAGLDLEGLKDNGDPTRTIALVRSGPAVDAVVKCCSLPATDQRGVSRPQNGDGDALRHRSLRVQRAVTTVGWGFHPKNKPRCIDRRMKVYVRYWIKRIECRRGDSNPHPLIGD